MPTANATPVHIEGSSRPPAEFGSAVVLRTADERGERAVVTVADDRIACTEELIAQITDPQLDRIPGEVEMNGDVLSFGTVGEGLGRLTYRRVGYDAVGRWHLFERVAN